MTKKELLAEVVRLTKENESLLCRLEEKRDDDYQQRLNEEDAHKWRQHTMEEFRDNYI